MGMEKLLAAMPPWKEKPDPPFLKPNPPFPKAKVGGTRKQNQQ
jgi:hypothetical protein